MTTHMMDLIRTLCERLAQGLERDPTLLADRLGRQTTEVSEPIRVVPSNKAFASADVFADDGQTSVVNLVPTEPLTLAALKEAFGTYDESPRLHPFDPRKYVFSTGAGADPYSVRVLAYVAADEPTDETARLQKVTITCSPASRVTDQATNGEMAATAMWQRFLGGHARFGARSLRRRTTLEAVRAELESLFGIQFVPCDDKAYDGQPAYACVTPACELRLNAWPSENPKLDVYNFIGMAPDVDETGVPEPERISPQVAEHLRRAGRDWYVPARVELLEEAGVLKSRLLDRKVIVSMLAPRWVDWYEGDERETGMMLLESIAEMWLSQASRAADPDQDVRRRIAEFHDWFAPPSSRLRVLTSYALQEQLSIIERELFDLKEMKPTDRAAVPDLAARLREWRKIVGDLEEPIRETGVNSIRSQFDAVLESIKDLEDSLLA